MRMSRRQREVLQNTHRDAREHSDEENHDAHAHHQRSDHPEIPCFAEMGASRLGSGERAEITPLRAFVT
jgi:hypothetical protein